MKQSFCFARKDQGKPRKALRFSGGAAAKINSPVASLHLKAAFREPIA
jgi:hypothetical protein